MKSSLQLISILALSALSAACSATGGAGGGDSTEYQEEVKEAVGTDCQTIGYSGVLSLTQDALQVDPAAPMFGYAAGNASATLEGFLETNKDALGGVGTRETRECTTTYFRTVSHLGSLSCYWLVKNKADVIFPNGAGDYADLFSLLIGRAPDAEEVAALDELSASITAFDAAQYASLEEKQEASVCSAVFSSLGAQTL